MVEQPSRKYGIASPNLTPLERTPGQKRYFFLDQKLYKMLRQERASDLLTAWDYDLNKAVQFVLSDAKRRMKPAYDTREVARLLNRSKPRIQQYVIDGAINSPRRIMEKHNNKYGKPFNQMKWSEDDIIALHEYLLTLGGGRPRKDGTLYPAARIPSRKELLAMLRQQPLFYMQTADGEMVPVWSAYNEV